MGEVGRWTRDRSQAWLTKQRDGLQLVFSVTMGWKQIHFSLHLENTLEDPKLFWALCFSPRPCAPGGSAWGHTVSVLQLFSMQLKQHSCTKVSEMDKGNVQSAWKTKNLLLRFGGLGFSLSDLMHIYWVFFPLISQFVVSVESAGTSTRLESISICKTGGNGIQLAIVHAPDEWTLYLVTWGFSPSVYMAKRKILKDLIWEFSKKKNNC